MAPSDGSGPAQNSGETARRGRPFRRGISGNPGGRPKHDVVVRDLCRALTPDVVETLMALVLDPKTATDQRIAAADRVLWYGWGKLGALEIQADGPEVRKIAVEYVNDWRTQDGDGAPALGPPGRPEPSDRH